MNSKCRLCGTDKSASELVIKLQSESQKVTLIDLVEYFCRVDISRDSSLPQNVCKSCKIALETFMLFCDNIEKYQKTLLSFKSEQIKVEQVDTKKLVMESKSEVVDPHYEEDYREDNDEDLDSPASNEDSNDGAGSTTSESTRLNLRNRALPEMRKCSIYLEKLDITYVRSDTESSSEDEEEKYKIVKRRRSSECIDQPPQKRMRISPIKVVSKVTRI